MGSWLATEFFQSLINIFIPFEEKRLRHNYKPTNAWPSTATDILAGKENIHQRKAKRPVLTSVGARKPVPSCKRPWLRLRCTFQKDDGLSMQSYCWMVRMAYLKSRPNSNWKFVTRLWCSQLSIHFVQALPILLTDQLIYFILYFF